MHFRIKSRTIPTRFATGAFILHSGLEKWHAEPEHAAAVHGMAAGAFPLLKHLAPSRFVRLLAASEIAIGASLLSPAVPDGVAGAALTGFSGSLLAMYWRTPALRRPGSVWPTSAGIGVSKDVWMLGIGLSLLVDATSGGGQGAAA
jgi:hypothetical protein